MIGILNDSKGFPKKLRDIFSHELAIPVPTRRQRSTLLCSFLSEYPLFYSSESCTAYRSKDFCQKKEQIALADKLAQITAGFLPSDLRNLCHMAYTSAMISQMTRSLNRALCPEIIPYRILEHSGKSTPSCPGNETLPDKNANVPPLSYLPAELVPAEEPTPEHCLSMRGGVHLDWTRDWLRAKREAGPRMIEFDTGCPFVPWGQFGGYFWGRISY